MGQITNFQQLEVWQQSHQLVLAVYRVTKTFPTDEKYGLVSQMRRAAVFIPANIAEGFKRRGQADKIRFYKYQRNFSGRTQILLYPLQRFGLPDRQRITHSPGRNHYTANGHNLNFLWLTD